MEPKRHDRLVFNCRLRRRGFRAGPVAWVLVLLAALFLSSFSGRADGVRVLSGHVPPAEASLHSQGRLPLTNTLHLAIGLPLHNLEALTNLIEHLYDPSSPAFHHFLTPQQFTATFGPTEQDYQKVIDFAKSSGFAIVSTSSNRALVEIRGRVADVEKAFHVHMGFFQHPTEQRMFYAPEVEPTVDTNVPVAFIGGLNDYFLPRPASLHLERIAPGQNPVANNGSVNGYYVGQDFRSAYVPGITNTGSGQSVGLVEFDSYYPADISDYLALPQTGLSTSSVTLSNVVLGGLTGSPGSGNTEVALDIDMAISMAPGLSTVYVYEATNDSASADIVLNRMVSDNLSRQLSCSWSGFTDSIIQNDFLEFAAQGQSFFQSSGDSGAYTAFTRRNPNPVAPPTDNPNITVVGGTTLNTTGPQGNWVSETTWSWFTQPFNGLSNSATSGGISPTWSLPSYQQGISMSASHGSTQARNLPDVAMVANYIFLYANNGGQYVAGGTSAATPLWAGLTALINQQRAAQGQPSEGFMNPALYSIATGTGYGSCFHDITVGNNTNRYESTNYVAVPGFDLCTGWGSPSGSNLINILAPEPLQISPSTGFISSGLYGGPFTPTNQSFTLTNAATTSFNWALATSSDWLTASSMGGSLASGGTAAGVTLNLNAAATTLSVGLYTNTVWFTNVADSVVQSRQCTLMVSPATPALTWTDAGPITYGTALGPAQLDASADVPGAFSYFPNSGSILYAGTNLLTVIFTPADALDYNSVTDTISLVVTPASLTVTATSAAKGYGQPNPQFQGVITGLVNGDSITAAYNCAATTSSPVGTYPIIPMLIDPNDLETNYTVGIVDGSLSVSPANVIINWTNPAAISDGTVLSATQLNATADVPGTFSYSPSFGAVLSEGTNTLSTVFTPSDTLDYVGATDTVRVVVTGPVNTSPGTDTPLLPGWGGAGLAAVMAVVGAWFLTRQNLRQPG